MAFDVPTAYGNFNFRYFNQPIEQIPGFNAQLPQVLAHRPNSGLQWVNVVSCEEGIYGEPPPPPPSSSPTP
jgi:hypothetical protein